MASVPAAQAVTMHWQGPVILKVMAIWAGPKLARAFATVRGGTLVGPRSTRRVTASSMLPDPPCPVPMQTPVRSDSMVSRDKPASARASAAAKTENWV
jgi:hypothetical protein